MNSTKQYFRPSKGIQLLKPFIKKTSFGLITTTSIFLTEFQINSFKLTLAHFCKVKEQIILNLNTNISVSKKSKDSRMGAGVGKPSYTGIFLKKNSLICQLISTQLTKELILKLFYKSSFKLPMPLLIIHFIF